MTVNFIHTRAIVILDPKLVTHKLMKCETSYTVAYYAECFDEQNKITHN